MNAPARTVLAASLLLPWLGGSPAAAQTLHLNDRWRQCAILLDPSLSQGAWHQFVRELGLVAYFRPVASAEPMGKGHFEVAFVNWGTRIDDEDAAWNDTFSHPDSAHWLFEGDALRIPGLMVRAGVTDRVDAGAYYTKAIGANYSILGGQLQYALLKDRERGVALAGRASGTWLVGPEDMSAGIYGVDLVASKKLWVLTPYGGVSGYLSRGSEHTPKVALEDENVLGVQGTLGVAATVSVVRLGAEVNLARVPGYSIKVAFVR